MEVLEFDSDDSIKIAEGVVAKMKQESDHISQRLSEKMLDQREVSYELSSLRHEEESTKWEVNLKVGKLNELQLSLDKLSFANTAYRGEPMITSCLSVDEVDKQKLQCLMLHGSKNRANEKKLLKEISSNQKKDAGTTLDELGAPIQKLNQKIQNCHTNLYRTDLEAIYKEIKQHELAREKAVANAAVNGKLWNSLGSKKDIQERVKVMYKELDELRTRQVEARDKAKPVKKKLEFVEKQIISLQKQLEDINHKRKEAPKSILELGKQHRCEK